MDTKTRGRVLQLVGLFAASTIANRCKDEATLALLQTGAIVRSTMPSGFFEEPVSRAQKAAWRSGAEARERATRTQDARFDVGSEAVPVPLDWDTDDAGLLRGTAQHSGIPALSLAEAGARAAAPSMAAWERQALSGLPAGAERPITLLERQEQEQRRTAAQQASNVDVSNSQAKLSVILATEPPLVAMDAKAKEVNPPGMPRVRRLTEVARDVSLARQNVSGDQDVGVAEAQDEGETKVRSGGAVDEAAKFVVARQNVSGDQDVRVAEAQDEGETRVRSGGAVDEAAKFVECEEEVGRKDRGVISLDAAHPVGAVQKAAQVPTSNANPMAPDRTQLVNVEQLTARAASDARSFEFEFARLQRDDEALDMATL